MWGFWALTVVFFYAKSGHDPFFPIVLWGRVFPPFLSLNPSHLFYVIPWLLYMTVCLGLGRILLQKLLKIKNLNALDVFAFGLCLGHGLLGFVMFGLGSMGWWGERVIWSVTTVLFSLAVIGNLDLFQRKKESPVIALSLFSGFWGKTMAVLAFFALFMQGFYSLAPVIFYDALVYHLAVPKIYQLAGGLVPTPTNLYSGIPMHMQTVYGWALFVSDEILAQLIHWSQALGLFLGFLGISLRKKVPIAGWTACAVFFSTPLVGGNISRVAVDGASAFVVFLSVYAFSLYLDTRERNLWILSALCTGLAMGIKYPNWPFALVLGVCFLLLRISLKETAIYGLIVLACVFPWVMKNWVFYGNPIFPYFHEWWNPLATYPVHWRGLQGDAWARDWKAIFSGGIRPVLDVVLHPWNQTIKGISDDDFLGPLFLVALPGFIFFRGETKINRIWLWVLFGLWMVWWPMTRMPRFFMPGLALFSLVVGFMSAGFPRFRSAVFTLVMVLVVHNLFWNAGRAFLGLKAGPYLEGLQSKSDYLSSSPYSTYSTPSYPSYHWINKNTPRDAHVLVLGDARGFYLDRPFQSSSVFDTDLFTAWVKRSSSSQDFVAKLKKENITHLAVNMGEMMRLRRNAGFNEQHIQTLAEFFSTQTRQVFSEQRQSQEGYCWNLVYEIAPSTVPVEQSPVVGWYARQWMESKSSLKEKSRE